MRQTFGHGDARTEDLEGKDDVEKNKFGRGRRGDLGQGGSMHMFSAEHGPRRLGALGKGSPLMDSSSKVPKIVVQGIDLKLLGSST